MRTSDHFAFRVNALPQVMSAIDFIRLSLAGGILIFSLNSQAQVTESRETIEEVRVLAPRIRGNEADLLQKRKSQKAVAEVLGSQQMSRTGDSDAASGLRRVTGITLMDGKYVFVRGLGERYVQAELNSFSLPSPEPARRVVPLDLFPASILESITVQKSFEARTQGEFGGGLVQLETQSHPESFFLKASISQSDGALGSRLTGPQASSDALGVDRGYRKMPEGIRETFLRGKKISSDSYTDEALDAMGRSLVNQYSVEEKSSNLPPSVQLAIGSRWDLNSQITASLTATGFYGNSADQIEKRSQKFDMGSSGLTKDESVFTQGSETEYRSGYFLSHGLKWTNHLDLSMQFMKLGHTSSLVNTKQYKRESGTITDFLTTEVEWIERELELAQIKNEVKIFSSNTLQWDMELRGQVAHAGRRSPDRREYTYELRDGLYKLNVDTKGNLRSWSELEEKSQEWGFDQNLRWNADERLQFSLKGGVRSSQRERVSDTLRLKLSRKSSPDGESLDLTLPPEELFVPENINKDGFRLSTVSDSADSMTGEQRVFARYLQGEAQVDETWTFALGTRFEDSLQLVRTYNRFENQGQPTQIGGIEARDQLPYGSVRWQIGPRSRLQMTVSETVARPELREVSDIIYREEDTDFEVKGNPFLKQTVIRNFDLRFEDYYSSEEMMAVSFFQKNFENPIEEVFLPSQNLLKTFDNARGATNRGVEFESRVQLRTVDREYRFWSVGMNLALIDSQIDLSGDNLQLQTSKQRPLQGQSPWIVNTSLFYDRPGKGWNGALVFNVIGPRIVQVGTNSRPDIYERPFEQLDFVVSKALDKNWRWGGRLKNILNPKATLTQGSEVFQEYRKGYALSLNLSGSFP